jgi:hypothetical protein
VNGTEEKIIGNVFAQNLVNLGVPPIILQVLKSK